MAHKYTFVAHHLFDYYLDQILAGEPGLQKSFDKQIDLIKTNPEIGTPMKYAPPDIAGRIRKKKMGGRRGYSICYIVFEKYNAVLGVYVTPEPRDEIDYRKFPWEILVEAKDDFVNQRKDKLRIIE